MKSLKRILIIALLINIFISGKAQVWSRVGNLYQANYEIIELKKFGPDIYAVVIVKGDTTVFVAKWNGLYWAATPKVRAYEGSIAMLNDTLYISHNWSFQEGIKVERLVGNHWERIPVPIVDTLAIGYRYLTAVNNELYLHGSLITPSKVSIGAMKYKNGSWTVVGPATNAGINGLIYKVIYYNSNVVFCARSNVVTNSNGLVSKNIIWNGTSWQKFNNRIDSCEILHYENDTLFYIRDSITPYEQLYKKTGSTETNISFNSNILSYYPDLLNIHGVYYFWFHGMYGYGLYMMKNNYWVKIHDTKSLLADYGGELHASSTLGQQVDKLNSNLAFVKGNIFKDLNTNCAQDSTDILLKNSRNVLVMPDSISTTIDEAGNYFIATTPGSKYLSNHRLSGSRYLVPASCSSVIKTVTTYTDSIATVNFPMKDSAGVTDVSIKIFPQGGARIRKNMNDYVHLILTNYGTTTVSSGTVKLRLDTSISIVSATPSYASFANNILTWNYTNLAPDSIKRFSLQLQLSTGAIMGDSIQFTAWVTPATDANSTDNADSVKCKIVSSYDPNDKQCFPADVITKATPNLNYTIRFQNTGTAEAINVYIIDTMDTNLPMEKIEITGWSTATRPKVEIKNSRILIFSFLNIMLPDSHSNEPKSHGFVSYRCSLTKPMQVGTIVKNRADIYFDFNEAVPTNITQNTCLEKIGFDFIPNKNNNVRIYPNPAQDKLTIDLTIRRIDSKKAAVKLFDANGRLVMEDQILNTDFEQELNINKLVNGIYVVCVYDENGLISAQKIAVAR